MRTGPETLFGRVEKPTQETRRGPVIGEEGVKDQLYPTVLMVVSHSDVYCICQELFTWEGNGETNYSHTA